MTNHILQHPNKILQNILNKLEELRVFNTLFKKYVASETAKYCEIVKFEKNCLIVLVENGNWTTQLRFQIPELMSKLRQHPELASLNGIICKTRPKSTRIRTTTPSRQVAYLSISTANRVLNTAKSIKNKKLREALEKISRHLSSP